MFILYKVTNKVNNKSYFGITKTKLSVRWSGHKSEAKRGSSTKFHKAIRKYGVNVWVVEKVLCCNGKSCASYLEDAHILLYNTIQEGYNSCPGGYQSTKQPGYKHTTKARKKIQKNANLRKIPVYQFDEYGVLVQMWDSAMDAAIGIYKDRGSSSNISKCAKRYKGQTYVRKSGFRSYSFGYTPDPPQPLLATEHQRIHKGAIKRCDPIIQCNIDDGATRLWPSAAEASRVLGIPATSIYKVLRGEMTQTHGFRFVFS